MGLFDKFNAQSNNVIMEGINIDNMEYAKISALKNSTIPVKGFFFTKSNKYGKIQLVVVSDKYLVNMPDRAVAQFEGIKNDEEAKAAVLAGKLAIKIGDSVTTNNGTTTHYDLVEI